MIVGGKSAKLLARSAHAGQKTVCVKMTLVSILWGEIDGSQCLLQVETLERANAASVEALSFHAVRKSFGAIAAVDQFSLGIRHGEFVTFLGPSGSGKTTVLNMLAGFMRPSAGRINLRGRDITSLRPEHRDIGMVFQQYSLFPHMTVLENVAFPLRMRGVDRLNRRERALRALQLVRLSEFAERSPRQLSGGQQQRVAFARAVVANPSVLLMDEPLAALDLKLREAMKLEIRQIRQVVGSTFIYVTHDQSEALALSDRIVVMNAGRIEQVGTPAEIYDEPKTRFVASFLGESNTLTTARTADGWLSVCDVNAPAFKAPGDGAFAVSIRPEKLKRRTDGQHGIGHGRIQAAVQDVVFLGEIIRYYAVMPSGQRVTFSESRLNGTHLLQSGETVELEFRLDDMKLVTDEKESLQIPQGGMT